MVVDRPELRAAIAPLARSAGFQAELGVLDGLDEVVSHFEREMADGPGFEYLAFQDVEPEEVRVFLEPALKYFALEPWNWLEDDELIRVEGLAVSPLLCSVLGAAGLSRGLAIFLEEDAADLFLSGQVRGAAEEAPVLCLTWLDQEEISLGLNAEILKHAWPTSPEGFPVLVRTDRAERPAPTSGELALARLAVEAVVDFLEDEDLDRLSTAVSSGDTVTVRWDALCEFCRAGGTPGLERRLKKALKASPAIGDYLLGRRVAPERDPEVIYFGEDVDAELYASRWKAHWERSEGALECLQRAAG